MSRKHESIIGPNPCPEPPQRTDALLILSLALVYLAFLILIKGTDVNSALSVTAGKFGIRKDILRKAARVRLWR